MKKNSSIIGIFDDKNKLLQGMDEALERGFKIQDVIMPWPMHEVFEKLKLQSRMPILALLYGIFAILSIAGFLYYTSVVDYPLRYGGKPQNTLSFIVVIFVMTINITALFTIITFFLREKKGPGAKVDVIDPDLTDDKFALFIERKSKMTEEEVKEIESYLNKHGAIKIIYKDYPKSTAD